MFDSSEQPNPCLSYFFQSVPNGFLWTFSTEIQLDLFALQRHDLREVYFKIGCSSKHDRLRITYPPIHLIWWVTDRAQFIGWLNLFMFSPTGGHLGGGSVMTSRSELVRTILVRTVQVSPCTFKQSQVFSGGSLYLSYIDINYWLLLLLSPASGWYWVIAILAAEYG